jgi:hypothetical protein
MISFRRCAATVIEESLAVKENRDLLPRKEIVSRYRASQVRMILHRASDHFSDIAVYQSCGKKVFDTIRPQISVTS